MVHVRCSKNFLGLVRRGSVLKKWYGAYYVLTRIPMISSSVHGSLLLLFIAEESNFVAIVGEGELRSFEGEQIQLWRFCTLWRNFLENERCCELCSLIWYTEPDVLVPVCVSIVFIHVYDNGTFWVWWEQKMLHEDFLVGIYPHPVPSSFQIIIG